MKCPACKDVTLSIGEREGIEIDYCPQCRGVWLDRGELDKVIARSESETGWRESKATRRDEDHRRRPRRSFLRDLFD